MSDLPEIDALLSRVPEGYTPGPWRWEINRKCKTVEICGGLPSGKFDKTVLSFARWGMNRAAPIFWFWRNGGHWSEEPKRADELAVAVSGREHHADWFAGIDHPDAALIALAPELAAALRAQAATIAELTRERDAAREALQALVDEYVDYQIINNLGDPEKQHNIRRARAALGRFSAEAAATAPAQEGQADG